MRSMSTQIIALLLITLVVTPVLGSSLTRQQILKELTDLETCVRTMCLPSGDATMGSGYARNLVSRLGQSPNALDRWVIQRLNGVVLLLTQRRIAEGLHEIQATIRDLPSGTLRSRAPQAI